MQALFIGSDPLLLDPTSPASLRLRSYAEAIGHVHILMRADAASLREDGPLTVEGLQTDRLRSVHALAERARAIITEKQIEVVSAQDPFEHGWAARRATKGTNVKLHIQVHTDFLSPWFTKPGNLRSPQVSMPAKNTLRQVLADRILPKADGIRVVSERIKTSLVKRYGTKIVEPTVLPIAVGSVVPPAEPLPPHSFPFVFMTVGRLEPEKRIEDILEALARITTQYPAMGLMIVGEGRERTKLMTMVLEKGLTGKVIFAGAPSTAWGMMRSAQAYIQTSAYEGYGRTLVEAALARVPIITTDVGIVGEVFKGYEDVLSAPPGDPAQLASHMVAVLEDVGARELMMRSAEAKALAHVNQYPNLPELIARDLSRLTTGSTS